MLVISRLLVVAISNNCINSNYRKRHVLGRLCKFFRKSNYNLIMCKRYAIIFLFFRFFFVVPNNLCNFTMFIIHI